MISYDDTLRYLPMVLAPAAPACRSQDADLGPAGDPSQYRRPGYCRPHLRVEYEVSSGHLAIDGGGHFDLLEELLGASRRRSSGFRAAGLLYNETSR